MQTTATNTEGTIVLKKRHLVKAKITSCEPDNWYKDRIGSTVVIDILEKCKYQHHYESPIKVFTVLNWFDFPEKHLLRI